MVLRLLLLSWVVVLTVAVSDENLYFNHENSMKHEKSGEEFYMKKSGKVAGLIDLDDSVQRHDMITDIKCVRNGIRVYIDPKDNADPHAALGGHYDITQVWLPGMIVRSRKTWNNCKSMVDGTEIDGIYQKVKEVLFGMNNLFISTVPAGFADNFEELEYTVHHKRGDWTGVPDAEKEEHRHRVRRSVMTNDDLILRLTQGTRTKSIFEPDQHLSLSSNWNSNTKKFDKSARIDSSEKQVKFYDQSQQSQYSPKNSNNWWDLYCKECYATLEGDTSAKLVIKKREIVDFEVKINGVIKLKRKFKVHTKGDKSEKVEVMISSSKGKIDIPVMIFDDVLKKDVMMHLNYDFAQYINADIDFEAVKSEFEFDIYEEGILNMTFTRQSNGSLMMDHQYTQINTTAVDPKYDFSAVLSRGKVNFKAKLDLDFTISWADQKREIDGKKTFLFQLGTNMKYKVGLSQTVDFSTYIYGYGTVCTRPTHDLWLSSDVSLSTLEYKVLGKIFWWGNLYPAMATNTQLRTATEFALCQDAVDETTCCFVQLTGAAELNADKTPEQACGKIIRQVERSYNEFFSKMIQLKSNKILFKNEEHTQKWCGSLNYPCTDCRKDVAGYTKRTICADRHMSLDMSEAIKSLAELVMKDPRLKNRKLMVINAFDEPTELNPIQGNNWGKFAWNSIHKEGRAAQIAISRKLTDEEMNYKFTTMPSEDKDAGLMRKLGQMAVMAEFDYVKIYADYVHVGVKHGSWITGVTPANTHFATLINSTYAAGISVAECNKFFTFFPQLLRGMQRPKGTTMDSACGKIGIPVTRYHKRQFKGLYYYPYNDVVFTNPKRNDAWCGMPGRSCIDCRTHNGSANVSPSKRCRDRVMTHRLAFRLRRLAKLVEEKWSGANKLVVEFAWDEPTATAGFKWGTWKNENSHHRTAQALWLKLTGNDGVGKLVQLGQLAQCAGFDFVEYPPPPKPQVIWVCVKRENKPRSFVVPFPTAQLQASRPGFFAVNGKYAYPGRCDENIPWCGKIDPKKEPYLSQFFDSSIYEKTKLVGNLTLKNFTEERFARIDQYLVECVGSLIAKGGLNIRVTAGFRNQLDNEKNRETKHDEEKIRHQSGHAVIVEMAKGTTGETELITIGKAVIKICGNQINPQQRMLGIGVHKNELYFDFRPKPWTDPPSVQAKMWTHDGGSAKVVTELEKWLKVVQGGPAISALDVATACTFKLGEENYYFNFKTDAGFFADRDCTKKKYSPEFCKKTQSYRKQQMKRVEDMLKKKAQLTTSHRDYAKVKKALMGCLVDDCNECNEGPVWTRKVENCMTVLNFYKNNSGNPFGNLDKLSIYNMNTESAIDSVSSFACDDRQYLCVEKTELFGIFAPSIRARYKPNRDRSIEVELYGEKNPSPLLEMIHQMLAMNAKGNVTLFIDKYGDLGIMKKLMKIMMTYNTKVDLIKVYFSPSLSKMKSVNKKAYEIKENMIMSSIVNSADIWAGTVCPKKARPALTPYAVGDPKDLEEKKSKTVLAQEAKDVAQRKAILNWELEWVDKRMSPS